MQTSIAAWLRKPAAVLEPKKSQLTTPSLQQTPNLPTPPSDDGLIETGPAEASKDAVASVRNEEKVKATQSSVLRTKKDLPSNISLKPCTRSTLPAFKRLTGLLLAIPYPNKFYEEILSDPITNSITLLAIWHDDLSSTLRGTGRVVGGIRCRLLPTPTDSSHATEGEKMLYVSTLCVLSPFQSHGIATHLLQSVIVQAIQNYGIRSVGAHVWEKSTEAREWYGRRGFRELSVEKGYYRRLDPQGAVVIRREIGPGDLLGGGEVGHG